MTGMRTMVWEEEKATPGRFGKPADGGSRTAHDASRWSEEAMLFRFPQSVTRPCRPADRDSFARERDITCR